MQKMEKKVKLLPPIMPNFARIEQSQGMVNASIPIRKFTATEAEEYGELMKQTFIEHWQKLQTLKN